MTSSELSLILFILYFITVKYIYGEDDISSHLFEHKIDLIDISELKPESRIQQGIHREIERIWLHKKI